MPSETRVTGIVYVERDYIKSNNARYKTDGAP
jgi:hypothetical protein